MEKKNLKYSCFLTRYKSYENEYKMQLKNYKRQKDLYPEFISKQELENSENKYLQSIFDFSDWLQNQKIQEEELYLDFQQKLEDCNLKIMDLKKKIENANVVAMEAGYVNEFIHIKEGDSLLAETQVLSIIPFSNQLKCIVKIPCNSISKIKENQNVFFQIKDLPSTKYGKLQGKINLIPADVRRNESPFFPVEINLDKCYLQNWKKEKLYIRVGTKVIAKINTDSDIY